MKWQTPLLLSATILTLCKPSPAAPADIGPGGSGVDARMLRYPDVSATQIAFVYAGDIWVAPKDGGSAMRLSSPRGEESFPRFSPDGTQIAFSGNYDGNMDIYVVPAAGGLPHRVTWHGAADRMLEWYPDGKSILFATPRSSEKDRFNQLYKIPAEGGLAEKLPLPYGEFGAISDDGKTLAYIPISVDFRTWKRYRGGMNPGIWLFNLETFESRDITGNEAANSQPMWHGKTLYFLSDRDKNKRANLWAYDTQKNKFRQVTTFEEFDVKFPSIGPEDIVFENGGRLFLMSLAGEKYHEVSIQVLTDRATLKPHLEDVSRSAGSAHVSPAAKRIVVEARGELFTVPAEHGVVRNLTRTPGVAERYPAWSPDGKNIAFFSDRTGEYELTLRPADGTGQEQVLTKLGPGYRYRPVWSPDSKKLVFVDQTMRIHLLEIDKKETIEIGRQLWMYHDELERLSFSWSSDSRWVAWGQDLENRHTAIQIYDTKLRCPHQVTTGYYDDDEPAFDPEGKFIYYRSSREMAPVYSDMDNSWVYANSCRLMAAPLRADVPSPLAPRNDEEGEKKTDKPKDKPRDEKKPGEDGRKPNEPQVADKKEPSDAAAKPVETAEKKDKEADEKADKPEAKTAKAVEIELTELERRAVLLPTRAGNFANLIGVPGKLIYRRLPRSGGDGGNASLLFFDFEKREDKQILENADQATLAARGDKLLVRRDNSWAIIEPKEGQRFDKTLPVGGLEMVIDPAAEWQQVFTDAWRLERDFFYDPHMHGVDWNAMRQRYGGLLKHAVTRWDVNYLLGELIGELNASHTYRSGGDVESEMHRGVGYLGVDFSLENGCFRIHKIVDGAEWDAEERSPLKQPDLNVSEGDYLLAVNGLPLETNQEPYAVFQGLAGRPVFLTVNNKPDKNGAREILVQTMSSEARLRHFAWIESNRKRVDAASGGKIGYVYVPDTGRGGQAELVRQFRPQFNKEGMIIDERFNSGGQIPDRFIELLSRKNLNYWGVRDGKDWLWPQVAHSGPKAMLINGWSGSGGDCFPFYFKQAGLGPLIGSRTWGGLIGMTGSPGLVDGGKVTVPTFGIYSNEGEWIIEGSGVSPDIHVVDDPSQLARGVDPQLERAIQEVSKALQDKPASPPAKPKYPLRAGL